MAEVERRIYFYKVEMHDGEWRRAVILRGLATALTGDDQVLDLGSDNNAWALVDRVPTTSQTGRLPFFRDRRSNLPAWAHQGQVADLPIPEGAGVVEPTHVVLSSDGLIAAEYNHFAPRIATDFARLLRDKLSLDLSIQTYVRAQSWSRWTALSSRSTTPKKPWITVSTNHDSVELDDGATSTPGHESATRHERY